MPIFEYECKECHKRIERLERVLEESPELTCADEHDEVVMEKIISSSGSFVLKGNWYKNNRSY